MTIYFIGNENGESNYFISAFNKLFPTSNVIRYRTLDLFITDLKTTTSGYLFIDAAVYGGNAIKVLKKSKSYTDRTKIIYYSSENNSTLFLDLIQQGIHGFIVRTNDLTDLKYQLQVLFNNGYFLSPSIVQSWLEHAQGYRASYKKLNRLSDKDIVTLQLLSDGLNYESIATSLELTIDGVRSRIRRLYRKLNVSNRWQAIIKYEQYRSSV